MMVDRLRAAGRLEENVPLGPLTTYKLGGPARYLVTVDEEDDLPAAWALASAEGLPVVALGRGSNVVVSERGFAGVVLRAGHGLGEREIGEEVVAGASVALPMLAREAARRGRGGLEFYTGIPGSVGGAVRMNAGCHGSETRDVLVAARVFSATTGLVTERTPQELGLAYRHSDLDDTEFVVSARFVTVDRDAEECEEEIRRVTRWRREHQPGGTLNAGSVFKNPPHDSAGRLIEAAGLKGLARGAVRVSERHANFIVAGEGALAADLYRLVEDVRAAVLAASGVDLEPEIRFLGDFS